MRDIVVEFKNVRKYFPLSRWKWRQNRAGIVKAVDGVSLAIREGETFGLVGESGCGKTTLSRLLLRLEKPTSGTALFQGSDIHGLTGKGLRDYRCSVQAVFQDPASSLSPRMLVRHIIAEPLAVNSDLSKSALRDRVGELLELVGLRSDAGELYPHEFSGGQRQRIAVARALALNPKLIVLDEPVSALDVSIRAQIMNLLADIQEERGLAYLLIAHDLAIVKHMSTKVGIMYLGKLVELAETEELYTNQLHPYTRALLSAALPSHPEDDSNQFVLGGEVPSPINPPCGCRFHPRCPEAQAICSAQEPGLREAGSGHTVACHSAIVSRTLATSSNSHHSGR